MVRGYMEESDAANIEARLAQLGRGVILANATPAKCCKQEAIGLRLPSRSTARSSLRVITDF